MFWQKEKDWREEGLNDLFYAQQSGIKSHIRNPKTWAAAPLKWPCATNPRSRHQHHPTPAEATVRPGGSEKSMTDLTHIGMGHDGSNPLQTILMQKQATIVLTHNIINL